MSNKLDSKRPISPHLTIYRPQITSVFSIFHRITGIGLFFAINFLVWAFILRQGDMLICSCCCIIKLAALITFFGFSYHLLNGIRHLIWDIGYGFEIKEVNISAAIVLISSLILTFIFWSYLL